jgi:hypothetical protein
MGAGMDVGGQNMHTQMGRSVDCVSRPLPRWGRGTMMLVRVMAVLVGGVQAVGAGAGYEKQPVL